MSIMTPETDKLRDLYNIFMLCADHVMHSDEALTTEGVLRISGNKTSIEQALTFIGNELKIPENTNVHDLVGIMKLIVNEKISPISIDVGDMSSNQSINEVIDKIKQGDEADRIKALMLQMYIRVAERVMANQAQNKMNATNVAIVLAPVFDNLVFGQGIEIDLSDPQSALRKSHEIKARQAILIKQVEQAINALHVQVEQEAQQSKKDAQELAEKQKVEQEIERIISGMIEDHQGIENPLILALNDIIIETAQIKAQAQDVEALQALEGLFDRLKEENSYNLMSKLFQSQYQDYALIKQFDLYDKFVDVFNAQMNEKLFAKLNEVSEKIEDDVILRILDIVDNQLNALHKLDDSEERFKTLESLLDLVRRLEKLDTYILQDAYQEYDDLMILEVIKELVEDPSTGLEEAIENCELEEAWAQVLEDIEADKREEFEMDADEDITEDIEIQPIKPTDFHVPKYSIIIEDIEKDDKYLAFMNARLSNLNGFAEKGFCQLIYNKYFDDRKKLSEQDAYQLFNAFNKIATFRYSYEEPILVAEFIQENQMDTRLESLGVAMEDAIDDLKDILALEDQIYELKRTIADPSLKALYRWAKAQIQDYLENPNFNELSRQLDAHKSLIEVLTSIDQPEDLQEAMMTLNAIVNQTEPRLVEFLDEFDLAEIENTQVVEQLKSLMNEIEEQIVNAVNEKSYIPKHVLELENPVHRAIGKALYTKHSGLDSYIKVIDLEVIIADLSLIAENDLSVFASILEKYEHKLSQYDLLDVTRGILDQLSEKRLEGMSEVAEYDVESEMGIEIHKIIYDTYKGIFDQNPTDPKLDKLNTLMTKMMNDIDDVDIDSLLERHFFLIKDCGLYEKLSEFKPEVYFDLEESSEQDLSKVQTPVQPLPVDFTILEELLEPIIGQQTFDFEQARAGLAEHVRKSNQLPDHLKTQREAQQDFTENLLYAINTNPSKDQVAKDFSRTQVSIILQTQNQDTKLDAKVLLGNQFNLNGANTIEQSFFYKDGEGYHADETEQLLKVLSQNNPQMYDYLKVNAHQGGFLNRSRDFMFNVGITSNPDCIVNTHDSKAEFIVNDDGSLTYVESFSLNGLTYPKDSKRTIEPDEHTPLARVTMRSTIRVVDGKVQHDYEPFEFKVKDPRIESFLGKVNLCSNVGAKVNAIYNRGQSFIEAAKLMIRHSEISQNDKLAGIYLLIAIENEWAKKPKHEMAEQDLLELNHTLIKCAEQFIYKPKKLSIKQKIQSLLNPKKHDELRWGQKVKIKKDLEDAENHVNWQARQTQHIHLNHDGAEIKRTETPITTFTQAQQAEWLQILPEQKTSEVLGHPAWFESLPKWEQNYFQEQVRAWIKQKDTGVANLGDFLGTVPTTIRKYPGAPNAYETSVNVTFGDHSVSFNKIRSGVIVPYKLKANSKAKKARKVELTTQNLEQLVIKAFESKIDQLSRDPKANTQNLSMPILLQTLFSPPFDPPGSYSNESILKALENLRSDLQDPQAFIDKHGIDAKGCTFDRVDLLYTSRPVNIAKHASMILTNRKPQGVETKKSMKVFKAMIDGLSEPLSNDEMIAKQAFEAIQKITPNKLSSSSNYVSEIAALEQVMMAKLGGIRIGSCNSGKDREEMVTEIAIAMVEFYAKFNKFPPPPNPKNLADTVKRAAFVDMVARQYLTGAGQKLAGENAKGCDGLKGIEAVFKGDICDRIRSLAKEYGIEPEVFKPVKDTNKMAGLNRVNDKKVFKVKAREILDNALVNMKDFLHRMGPQKEAQTPKEVKRVRRQSWTPGMQNDRNGQAPLVRSTSTTQLKQEVPEKKRDRPKK